MLNGVHLPNVVRPRGGATLRRGSAAGRRRRLPQRAEAALKRAFAGEVVGIGMSLLQMNPQVAGAPARVQMVERDGIPNEGAVDRFGAMIGGLERRLAAFAKLAAQVPHGACG